MHGIHNVQVVNHFSHFLFLNLIIDLLNTKNGNIPRVLALTSDAHEFATGNLKFWKKFESIEDAKKELPHGTVKIIFKGMTQLLI